MTIINLLMDGGWVMVPLGTCSVLALAICIDRFRALRMNRVLPISLRNALVADCTMESLGQKGDPSALRNIVLSLFEQRGADIERASAALNDALIAEVRRLERFLTTLGTIAAISPLLGLLGTVLGMIDVFYALNRAGVRDPAVFSGGIGEALVTTAVGLCIAIPSLICHRHFQRRVDEFSQQLEQEGSRLIDLLNQSRTA